ncbi:thioredoxin [Helicobacter sp. MIT 05-5293]|uniref:thioredoxin family protein n=1 Tax=Helicobacter sp. MIT 05-5293 TaxID=1548149 RepID=UPI00051D43BD|nr:thioredoxin family protein [Helicobacter sp. MIT 05-5293]TLD80776.1 thioredoxin [Helicobacter sp. MIT 05-5293]
MVEIIDTARYKEEIKTGFVMIDFGASWCPDCRRVEPIVEKLAQDYANQLKIFKVSFDTENSLKEELNIRRIPTIIFYRDGVEVGERLIEPSSVNDFEKAIQNILGA